MSYRCKQCRGKTTGQYLICDSATCPGIRMRKVDRGELPPAPFEKPVTFTTGYCDEHGWFKNRCGGCPC
jgi:hypothetical protein